MCGNRVEELESRVKELEASVEGLTDELVECKVRLREMEAAADEEIDVSPEDAQQAAESADTPNTEATQSEDNEEDEAADADGDEIIVA